MIALTSHGGLWIVLRTGSGIRDRARRLAGRVLPVLAIFTIAGVPLTILVRPATVRNYIEHPALFVFPAVAAVSLFLASRWNRRGRELPAFLASSVFIVSALAGVAAALYPALLPSSYGSQFDITIFNAATGSYALRVGFLWWGLGITLAMGYFTFRYWMVRGKLQESVEYTHG